MLSLASVRLTPLVISYSPVYKLCNLAEERVSLQDIPRRRYKKQHQDRPHTCPEAIYYTRENVWGEWRSLWTTRNHALEHLPSFSKMGAWQSSLRVYPDAVAVSRLYFFRASFRDNGCFTGLLATRRWVQVHMQGVGFADWTAENLVKIRGKVACRRKSRRFYR